MFSNLPNAKAFRSNFPYQIYCGTSGVFQLSRILRHGSYLVFPAYIPRVELSKYHRMRPATIRQKMPALNLQHRRAHNLLLISKLLSTRDNASPFTLVIDNLEQSGKPVLREFIRRANVGSVIHPYRKLS